MKIRFNRRIVGAWLIAARQTFIAIVLWLIGFPLTLVMKRDPRLMIVINRPGTSFADNSKYFFVYATDLAQKDERIVMLTVDPVLQRKIFNAGGESVLHPSLQSFFLLLRCSKVVTDMDWFNFGSYPLTSGAKLIQLWHGAPLKHIELDLYWKRLDRMPVWVRSLLRFQKWIIGRYPIYDIVISTSQWFITEVFEKCFKARQFVPTGYPRNDILFGWPVTDSIAYRLAWINVDKKALGMVNDCKAKGYKICLYVPTFRKELDDPFKSILKLERLSSFAKENNLIFVLKLHPFMHGHSRIQHHPNIITYEPLCDVYPLMPECDLLITDYSSIYFDFLLLDRPILFFAYDFEEYITQDRNIYFDYEAMTPGQKCYTYDEFELQLKSIVNNGCSDGWNEMRQKVRTYTHDHIDNQANRRLICDHLRKL
jgi:CDP-glycerol glycerophosphotransferase (TagB/SpsB family)